VDWNQKKLDASAYFETYRVTSVKAKTKTLSLFRRGKNDKKK
jgi:hypothetical protein